MPDVIARLRPDGLTLPVAAIALLGAGLALARVEIWGPALHWDSVNYIEVARALLAGDGFTQPDWYLFGADAYAIWPPLYPMLLAGGGLGVADPYDVAGPLSAVSFGLTIFVAGRWMARRLESRILVVWACLALALSVPLSRAATAALSEAPFILLATLTLVQADAFLREGRRSALLWAVAFAALACLTRYLGVALIPVVALAPFLRGGVPLGGRTRLAVACALMAAAPLALWMLRTALLTGNAARAATDVAVPVHETLGRALEVLSRWMLPYAPLDRFQDAASALALLLLAFLAVRAFPNSGETGPARSALALFSVGYLLALAAGRAWSEGSDELRYFFPLYVPAVLLAATLCDPVIRGLTLPPLRPGFAVVASATVALALFTWLALHVPLQAREMRRENPIDIDAREPLWSVPFLRSIRTIDPIRTVEPAELVLSNGPGVLDAYFGAGRDYRALEYARTEAVARIRAAAPGAYVIWFHDLLVSVRYGYDARDLRGLPVLETVAERADGVVFRIGDGGANDWRRLAEAVAGAEPVASAFYDIHLIDGALVYVRAPCERADMGRRAFLHVFPADANDLSEERREHGFDNLDFTLSRTGAYFDGICIARAELPRYGIDRIHTGHFNSTGELWRVEFAFPDG